MPRLNVGECGLEEMLERGEFRCAATTLTERLGAKWIGASVYAIEAGDRQSPYHYHHGVEEWLYVISGAPILRDPAGERALKPGDLVAFPAGPQGAHTLRGPGRVVMFSAGAQGWGEAFVTVYPDSDKVAAAPGVMFRRSDALESRALPTIPVPGSMETVPGVSEQQGAPGLNLLTMAPELFPGHQSDVVRAAELGRLLGAQSWEAKVVELEPAGARGPYHYEWCRESWWLVLGGAPSLRHPEGEDALVPGDLVCFPEGPAGARQLLNQGDQAAQLLVISTPRDRPMSAFYPDEGTVLIRTSAQEGLLFRLQDQTDDYWDGEPGAGGP